MLVVEHLARVPRGRDLQALAVLMPIGKHPTLAAAPFDQNIVSRRAVRMAVNQHATVVPAERALDLARRHIHDRGRFRLLRHRVFLLQARRDRPALQEWLREEIALHCLVAYPCAELLIGNILGAQRVAMHEQRPRAEQIEHFGVWQLRGAGGLGEGGAKQKVPIAVHQVNPATGLCDCAQTLDHCTMQRLLEIVVTDPVIEQIAEDVQGSRPLCFLAQKAEKNAVDAIAAGREVKIGDEQNGRSGSICLRSAADPSPRMFVM